MAQGFKPAPSEHLLQSTYRARNVKKWADKKADGTEPPPGHKARSGPNFDSEGLPTRDEIAARALLEELSNSATIDVDEAHKSRAHIQHSLDFFTDVVHPMHDGCDHTGGPMAISKSSHMPTIIQPDQDKSISMIEKALKNESMNVPDPSPSAQNASTTQKTPLPPLPDDSDLNPSQRAALDHFLQVFRQSASGTTLTPDKSQSKRSKTKVKEKKEYQQINLEALRMIVHGGPGAGKTYFVQRVLQYAKHFGIEAIVGSYSAAAASLLPQGETLHSIASLSLYTNGTKQQKNEEMGQRIRPLNATTLKRLRDRYAKARFIIIDEISMTSVFMLSHISDRMKLIMGTDADFGGLGEFLTALNSSFFSYIFS